MKTTFLTLVLAFVLSIPVALAGNYDQDVNRAIDNLVRQPDTAYSAYKTALEHYRDERGNAFECLIAKLANTDPGTDINSDWDSCLARFSNALVNLKIDLLHAYKEAFPDDDYSAQKIGVQDFMPLEENFVAAWQGKRFFPEARSAILNGVKIAKQSLEDFDKSWEQLTKVDDELEAKKAEEQRSAKDIAVSAAKNLRELALKTPPGVVPSSLKFVLELTKHSDAFWQLCATEKGTVFAVFRTTRETAQKLYNERIRPEVSESFLKDAKSAAEGNSALTSREDFRTFANKALEILQGYVNQERDLSKTFEEHNKGRFIDSVSSEVIERLGGGAKMNQLVQDMELEEKTLEELLTKFEQDESASSASDEEKSSWRDLKDSLLSARVYDRWVQGYEDYKKSLDENGLKR